MRFYDEVKIEITSGKWGDGVVSARREAFVPYGWPSGWNGGKGGSIIFVASNDENTLLRYRYKRKIQAMNGEPGRAREQYGANASDVLLTVPIGTLIKDATSGIVLHVFSHDQEKWVCLPGGEGGRGNMMFKNAIRQYPNFSTYGEPWHVKNITLELQLLADVALIGTPSVGKSSLINVISNVKAKTAEYHFTTLIPHLWSVQYGNKTFNVIDVPGLIEGASEGKWLGNEFLRHILKARIFCLMVDGTRYDAGMQEVTTLLQEIDTYARSRLVASLQELLGTEDIQSRIAADPSSKLLYRDFFSMQDGTEVIHMRKHLVFVLNKIDMIQDQEICNELTDQLYTVIQSNHDISSDILSKNTFLMSTATRAWVDEWLTHLVRSMDSLVGVDVPTSIVLEKEKNPTYYARNVTKTESDVLLDEEYISKEELSRVDVREIFHPPLCKMVATLPWWNEDAEMRFWKEIYDQWYKQWVENSGVRRDDIIKVVSIYEGYPDRYIVWS